MCRPLLHKTVLKLKAGKKSGLYTKDIYGTRAFSRRDEFVRTSLLNREIILRVAMWCAKADYNHLKSKGMLQWPCYKEQEAAISRMLQIIQRSLDSFKSRRLKIGLFYLSPPPPNRHGHIMLHRPLYRIRMPLEEALERRRLQKKKKKILASYNITAQRRGRADASASTTETILQKVFTKSSSFNIYSLRYCSNLIPKKRV